MWTFEQATAKDVLPDLASVFRNGKSDGGRKKRKGGLATKLTTPVTHTDFDKSIFSMA